MRQLLHHPIDVPPVLGEARERRARGKAVLLERLQQPVDEVRRHHVAHDLDGGRASVDLPELQDSEGRREPALFERREPRVRWNRWGDQLKRARDADGLCCELFSVEQWNRDFAVLWVNVVAKKGDQSSCVRHRQPERKDCFADWQVAAWKREPDKGDRQGGAIADGKARRGIEAELPRRRDERLLLAGWLQLRDLVDDLGQVRARPNEAADGRLEREPSENARHIEVSQRRDQRKHCGGPARRAAVLRQGPDQLRVSI